MLIYFLLLLIWLVLSVLFSGKGGNVDCNPKSKWRFCLWASIPMILIMGLRGAQVGSDTPAYLDRFENSLYILTEDSMQDEVGYNYLNVLISNILGWNFNALLLITSFFICIVFARFVYHFSPDSLFSYFLHLTIGMFYMSMSGIRQCMAVSFCLLGLILVYKTDKKFKRVFAVLLVAIGYTFHNSAFFFLPFVLLPEFRLSKQKIIIALFLSAFLFIFNDVIANFFIQFTPSRYQSYGLDASYKANYLVYFIPLAIIIFCIISIKPDKQGKYNSDISMMFVFLLLNFFFMAFMPLNNQIGRISFYFINSFVILIPYAIRDIPLRDRGGVKIATCIVCLVYFILGVYGGTLAIDDYYFYWQNPK